VSRKADQLNRVEASLTRIEEAAAGHASAFREQVSALRTEVRAAMSAADAALEAADRAHAGTESLRAELALIRHAVAPAVPDPAARSTPSPKTAPGGGATGEATAARRSRTAPSAKQEK
jgi:hypothetical protein